jgi:hypothetical protein
MEGERGENCLSLQDHPSVAEAEGDCNRLIVWSGVIGEV